MSVDKRVPGADVAGILAMIAAGVETINTIVAFIKKVVAEHNLPSETVLAELTKCHLVTNTQPEELLKLIESDGD